MTTTEVEAMASALDDAAGEAAATGYTRTSARLSAVAAELRGCDAHERAVLARTAIIALTLWRSRPIGRRLR